MIDGTAYRSTGKPHLPDPFLPPPSYDWIYHPCGWTVNTLCGHVLRFARQIDDLPPGELCRGCARKWKG